MLDAEKDEEFGALRAPDGVQEWEKKYTPVSKVQLNEDIGNTLFLQQTLSESPLLRHAVKATSYIWAMDAHCQIWIAYEELAPLSEEIIAGTPRRKGEHIKKLGHPSLVGAGEARIAGEFFLDEDASKGLVWILNVQSGRYCRSTIPTEQNKKAILTRFQSMIGGQIMLDDDL